jgi:hypothetical protein
MPHRMRLPKLVTGLVAFLVLMVLLLSAVGGSVGPVELLIWFGLLCAGVVLMVRRFRTGHLANAGQ